jgi:predicted MFS family arabinose efflux permease
MLSFRIFLKRKYFAPAFLYSCFSLIFSTWVVYIPHVSERLHISEGKLGGALFFISVGALLVIPVMNRHVDRIGVGRSAFISFTLYALSLYGMFLATSYLMLCAALLFFGSMGSAFAISINSLTACIEKQSARNIMSGSHGFWSLGGMTGAAFGSFISARIDKPLIHISVLVMVLFLLQLWLKKEYIGVRSEPHTREKHRSFRIRPLLAIAAIGLIIMVSEGAVADWSALYLKKIVNIGEGFLGFGYALFSLGMTFGRFNGDFLSGRFGSWALLRRALAISLSGFLLVLITSPEWISLAGFFIVGLGFSVVVPEVYRLASRVPGIRTADGVSFIAATANAGFLMGPVVLGFIAELHTLHLSFVVLTAFVTGAFAITLVKRNQRCRIY